LTIDVRTKLTPPPVRKMSALVQSSLAVQTHHKFRKIRSDLHQKVQTSTSKDPPWTLLLLPDADVFYRQPHMPHHNVITR